MKKLIKKPKKVYVAIFIFIATFIVYFWNTPSNYLKDLKSAQYRRLLTSSDAVPNTFLPYLIYKHHAIDFSPITFYLRRFDGGEKTQYFISKSQIGKASSYPILTGIAAIPIYIVPLLLNKIASFDYVENIIKILLLGRITAIFYSSISVVLFYFLLNKLEGTQKNKIIFTLFFAIGTSMWSISSRVLWTHTIVVPILLGILHLLLKENQTKYTYMLLGFLSGLMILARPTTAIITLFIGLFILFNKRKHLFHFGLASIPPIALMLIYNTIVWGGPLIDGYNARNDIQWTTPLFQGIYNQIFTPGKGFFFITPPLMLIFVSIYKLFSNKEFGSKNNTLYRYLSMSFIFTFLMYSKWYSWYGGNSFGYRFYTDLLPIMLLLIYVLCQKLKPKLELLLYIFIAYSIYSQWNAVYFKNSRCEDEDMMKFNCITNPYISKLFKTK